MDRSSMKLIRPPGDYRPGKGIMNLVTIAIGFLLLLIINDSAIADNSKFSGTFALDLSVGSPVCKQSTGTMVIGGNSSKSGGVYYLYVPTEELQDTYTFTNDNGDVFTRTITVLDHYRFRFYQKKTTASYSTITDLVFVYSNDYHSFSATGSETGGSSCKGPTIYFGSKIGSNPDDGDEVGIVRTIKKRH